MEDDGWIEICRYSHLAEADADVLVLAAVGITCRLVPDDGGSAISLLVANGNERRAWRELIEYHRENRGEAPAPMSRPAWEGLDAALVYTAVLIVVHVVQSRHLFGFEWLLAGAARAGLILAGEWWRAFTALTLHADFGHLGSNIVAGSVLGVLLAQSLGPGLSWLAICLCGAVANALNALAQPPEHTAVGASTAVFAALGLLAALMWGRRVSFWRRGMRRWLPLAAGVMLLAFLGTGGERTDVGAHAFGFATGVIVGIGIHFAGPRIPQGFAAQHAYSAAALSLCGIAWLIAIGIGR